MAQSSRITEGHWHMIFMKIEAEIGQPAEEGCKPPGLAAIGAVSVHEIENGGLGRHSEIGRSQSSWGDNVPRSILCSQSPNGGTQLTFHDPTRT